MSEKVGWSEELIFERLKAQYDALEWVLLPQVRRGTGAEVVRTADAVAMNCWRSRGLVIHGFEFKSRRSDWIRELKAPQKQEQGIYRFCDRWYIVAGHPGLVKLEEVPDPWGFARPEGDKLKIIKKAPKLDPEPLDRPFVASVLRNVRDKAGIPDSVLRKKYQDGFEEGRKRTLVLAKLNEDRFRKELEDVRGLIREFEQESGLRVSRYSMGHIGEIVNLLRAFRPTEVLRRSKQMWERELSAAQQQVSRLDLAVAEAEELERKAAEARERKGRRKRSRQDPEKAPTE